MPTNVIVIRSFLDLGSYYRWFVEGFSYIATSLTQLTQKGVNFEWSNKCGYSFSKLKEKLISDLILTLLVSGAGFIVYNDASL